MRRRYKPKKLQTHTIPYVYAAIALLSGILLSTLLSINRSTENTNITESKPPIVAKEDMIDIPVPSKTIKKGTRLSSTRMNRITMPRNMQKDLVTFNDKFENLHAIHTLQKGEIIYKSKVSSHYREANPVVRNIPAGMRAITVRVDAESAVEGWARTGNNVDVIMIRKEDNSNDMQAKVIAENVKILSVGHSASLLEKNHNTLKPPRTATLLVSQQQALKIKTAAIIGRLTFSLRGIDDAESTTSQQLYSSDIYSKKVAYYKKETKILGKATGPDGESYVLMDDYRWIRYSGNPYIRMEPHSLSIFQENDG